MQLENLTKKELIQIIEKQKRMMSTSEKFYLKRIQELEQVIRNYKELNNTL